MKILVADDDPVNRRLLRALLSHEGHMVAECEDGAATLAWLENNPCDAVISDVLMPQMDGYRLCYEIRKNKKLKDTPVILYTATYLSTADEKAAMAMGADKFVRKPAPPEEILQALNEIVENGHANHKTRARKPVDSSALREYSEALVRKLEETNIELSVANAALAENERRLRAVIESEPECVKILAQDGTLLEMNPAGLRMIDADSPAQVVAKEVYGLIVPEHRRAFQALNEATFRGESGRLEFEIVSLKGTRRWLDTHTAPVRNSTGRVVAALGITRDITEQKRNAALLGGQMRVLEMIARGAPLHSTLDALLRVIEAQSDEMLCSILLLDADGRHLKHGAAPRLPVSYIQAIDGETVGEGAGSCGTAVHRRESVIVEDIASDPLWQNWRAAALSHSLRACWSTPIFDAQQNVLGTFAIYFRAPRRPAESHSKLIDIATHTAAIAIGKQREEAALRESETRFREMADSAPVMIWITQPDGTCTYLNKQWQDFTGQTDEAGLGEGWLDAVHPDDRARVAADFTEANRQRALFQSEYRLRRCDGAYRWIIDSAHPRMSESGEFLGYIGSVFDISELKQAEDERQRSLDRVRALHEINVAITSTMNRQSQLDVLLEKIERFFPYPIVSSLRLFRPDAGQLECVAQRGIEVNEWNRREVGRTLHRALQVVRSKEPVIVADVRSDAHAKHRPMPARFGLVSYAGVPLIARDQVIGVLGVYAKERHEFSAEEVEFLTTLAGQAAIAIENSRLFEESEQRRQEAEQLANISRSLAETMDTTVIGARVVSSVLDLFKVKGATIRLRQPDNSLRRFAAKGAVYSQNDGAQVLPAGVGLAGHALTEGKPIWSADTLNDPRVKFDAAMREHVTRSGSGSMIAMPLRVRDNVIGTLTLIDRTGREYTLREVDLLQAFADQASLALQNARLYQESESHLKRIEALRDIERTIGSTLDLDSVLNLLLEKMGDFLPFSAATTIRLFNPLNRTFDNAACRNIDEKDWHARVGRKTGKYSGQIVQTKRPVIVPNIQEVADDGAFSLYSQHGLVSYLGVPMIANDEVQGILGFYTREFHPFTEQEIDFLLTVAGRAAIAIKNARLYDEITVGKKQLEITNRSLDHSLKQLANLYSILAPLSPGASDQEIMDAIIGRLIDSTGADAGLIRIWDAETGNYRIVSQSGYPEPFLTRVEKIPAGGSADWVVQHGEPILAPDIAAEERFQGRTQLAYGFHSAAMLPLIAHDNVRGVMQLSSKRPGHFNAEHRDHLMAIASQMGTALENRRLYNDLERSRDDIERTNAALTESNRMLTALHAVASAASQSLNLNQILRAAIEKIIEIFHFDATRIHLFDKQRHALILRASFEHDQEHFSPKRTFRSGEGVVGAVANSGEKLIFMDAPNDPRYRTVSSKLTSGKHSHRFLAVLPIKGKVACLGTVTCVNDAPRSLAASEIQLLEAISDQLAVAIENSGLYEDVRSKVDELQLKTLELERANRVKDEFLGVVSHELRTPINVIMGYTSLFKEGILGAIEPAQDEALAKIARESRELLAMINTLLFTTTLETEAVAIDAQELSPEDLLAELRANYAVTAPGHVILEWRYPPNLPSLNTDRRKLKQILDNLLGNAIKFTEAGTVTVAARILDIDGNGARDTAIYPGLCGLSAQPAALEFSVSDTGVGIPKEKLDQIFDKFYQVDSSGTRRFGGVGLGLYIAKKFTDLLGGRLAVASTEGVGSTFTVTIPCESRAAKN
ncbi:MAG: GAF domain-containing protein [Chloroflexota bacterium]